MLARLQQALTLGALALGLVWLAFWWRAGHAGWAMAGLLALLLGHAAVLALEFCWMAHVNRTDAAPRATPMQHLKAWWGEVIQAPRVFCWRQPFRSHAWPDHVLADARGRRGLVLVHGFVCNRGLWNRWLPRLRAQHVPHVAVDLEPVFGPIEQYEGQLEAAVRRLEDATGLPPVVVAHSMGGLATRRWWVGTHADRLHHVVTIGTPHHGTWLARWGRSGSARQMRPGSRWQRDVQAREDAQRMARMTCFYGHCDNIVFPASTATLTGADNRHLAAVAHVHMVDRPEPFAEVMRRLGEG